MAKLGNEKRLSRPLTTRARQGHRFRGRGRFVEHGSVGDVHRGQVGDHGLEIDQRLQPALRDLRLIRRVGGVPARVLENVPLNDRRRDAIGITGADERARDLVAKRNRAQLFERFAFAWRRAAISARDRSGYFSERSHRSAHRGFRSRPFPASARSLRHSARCDAARTNQVDQKIAPPLFAWVRLRKNVSRSSRARVLRLSRRRTTC